MLGPDRKSSNLDIYGVEIVWPCAVRAIYANEDQH
jgi:hypothetical protein